MIRLLTDENFDGDIYRGLVRRMASLSQMPKEAKGRFALARSPGSDIIARQQRRNIFFCIVFGTENDPCATGAVPARFDSR